MNGLTILVIDDSAVIRNLLSEYLSDLGYTVDLAQDGLEGIQKALEGDYVAVFCDIHMPKRNGYQVFTEVSALKPELAFIMTDSLPDELADRTLDAGARICLTKPFDLKQIQQTLLSILNIATIHE